jgi:hypothetical protein
LPSFYFCQVGLPNCWRPNFLVLPKLYGCQVGLPNCWSGSYPLSIFFTISKFLKAPPVCYSLRIPRGTCQAERARAPPRVNFARNPLNSKKYRSQPVNPNPLYLPTSPSAPPRSLCPSSTPPPPLTFSLFGFSSSPLPALRRCRPAYSHRIQIRHEARLRVGATAPLLELREPRCEDLSLSACLDRFSALSSRSEEGLAALSSRPEGAGDRSGLAVAAGEGGRGARSAGWRSTRSSSILVVDIFPYTVHQVSRPFPASINMVSVSPSCCVATALELKVGESECG